MEQREMNFFELCAAFARAVAKGCVALWHLFCHMLRVTFQLWWVVLPCVILFVGFGLYYSRQDNLIHKVNGIALLNGATIQQFENTFAPLCSGQNIPEQAAIASYIYAQQATGFAAYRVIDCKNDGTADFVDFKGKSSPTDTTEVQMQDRIAIQFCMKEKNMHLLPEIENAVLEYFNSNPLLQQSYQTYLPNLKNEVEFNHRQFWKLDSLTSQYYFHNQLGSKSMSTIGEGVAFVGDRRVRLFLDEIYEQHAHVQRYDHRLQLATAPVVLESHFAADPKPLNGRYKCVVVFFLLGWIAGCLLAQAIRHRKAILVWLKQ